MAWDPETFVLPLAPSPPEEEWGLPQLEHYHDGQVDPSPTVPISSVFRPLVSAAPGFPNKAGAPLLQLASPHASFFARDHAFASCPLALGTGPLGRSSSASGCTWLTWHSGSQPQGSPKGAARRWSAGPAKYRGGYTVGNSWFHLHLDADLF